MGKEKGNTYFGHLKEAVSTSLTGVKLTLKHMKDAATKQMRQPVGVEDGSYFNDYPDGIVTLQYPREQLPVPDVGRYKLDIVMDDCIVCDKCAKICPVNCIEIEPVKSVGVIGETSDGTPKRLYAAKFNIDMGKCCFCGLCTTVCPTECLTMTKDYDVTEFSLDAMDYAFSEMTPEQVQEKKTEYEQAQAEKMKQKLNGASAEGAKPVKRGPARPAIKRPAGNVDMEK